jgi:hypothetical protein
MQDIPQQGINGAQHLLWGDGGDAVRDTAVSAARFAARLAGKPGTITR